MPVEQTHMLPAKSVFFPEKPAHWFTGLGQATDEDYEAVKPEP
jgi:hypothetical protein